MRGPRSDKSKSSNQESSSKIKGIEEAQKVRNELTEEQKREIKDAFSSFEEDGLSPEELKTAMQTLGFDANNPEVLKILDKIDAKKGPLKFDDFMDVMIDKNVDKDPEVEIRKAFRVLCEEGTDKITMKSLSKICADLGEKIGEDELQEMINEADKDQDDEVGEEDFIKIMQKTGMF
jgi:Ca2+-binding EF-hand superfamily protein